MSCRASASDSSNSRIVRSSSVSSASPSSSTPSSSSSSQRNPALVPSCAGPSISTSSPSYGNDASNAARPSSPACVGASPPSPRSPGAIGVPAATSIGLPTSRAPRPTGESHADDPSSFSSRPASSSSSSCAAGMRGAWKGDFTSSAESFSKKSRAREEEATLGLCTSRGGRVDDALPLALVGVGSLMIDGRRKECAEAEARRTTMGGEAGGGR